MGRIFTISDPSVMPPGSGLSVQAHSTTPAMPDNHAPAFLNMSAIFMCFMPF